MTSVINLSALTLFFFLLLGVHPQAYGAVPGLYTGIIVVT
jgi:hypothetical protein